MGGQVMKPGSYAGGAIDWYPLRLTSTARPMVFGGHAIARELGKRGLPDWALGETWEVSDVDGYAATVAAGALAGTPLRLLAVEHPDALMGRGWRGARFPLLTKFIDAAGTLPVHLHADDDTAQRLEGQPNGKTEAWHILSAVPGATVLCGVRPGVSCDRLHQALLRQDFDAVLRRLPVRAGQTVYVPGGTLHSFGPQTLVYEIEQTSDLIQHAMRWNMADGSPVPEDEWRANLDMLIRETRLEHRPVPMAGLRLPAGDGVDRMFCCAGPYFALERWTAGTLAPARLSFSTALIVTNVGAPVQLAAGPRAGVLGRGETVLLPAALRQAEIGGPADVVVGYLPDLQPDVVQPLLAAGYAPHVIAALGEGLTGQVPLN